MMTAETVRQASIAVAKAEQALAAAQAELKRAESGGGELTPAQILAIDLHSMLCHSDHTEACGWEYEIKDRTDHQWDRYTHAHYLTKAEALLARFPGLDVAFAGDLIRAIREL